MPQLRAPPHHLMINFFINFPIWHWLCSHSQFFIKKVKLPPCTSAQDIKILRFYPPFILGEYEYDYMTKYFKK